jgi:L-2-hydroxyglutarate oxidase
MTNTKYAIIGGGIVGLATAYRLMQRDPHARVTILEKEAAVAQHQSGHNSGVLHSGIYYKPGSLKATNCRAGKQAMEAFCTEHGIPFDICGKVIVAVDDSEVPVLERIYQRGLANGVRCEIIDRDRLLEREPHVQGVRAIHVPDAGIVDYKLVCQKLAELIQQRGGEIKLGAKVTRIERRPDEIVLESTQGEVAARYLITCAGLHSDRMAKLTGARPDVKIVPFRGEYFELTPDARHLCKHLVYPVPDPNFPFLGVHFTRMIDNSVECGPNAVLAFAREGYNKLTVVPGDLIESLSYTGFLKLASKYWRVGASEMWRSLSKQAFLRALQRLIPEIRGDQLIAAPAGVRAQAVGRDGSMVDDFLILEDGPIINVCNAPSPAATSSLNIGAMIADVLLSEEPDPSQASTEPCNK